MGEKGEGSGEKGEGTGGMGEGTGNVVPPCPPPQYKRGRDFLEDDSRPGRPVDVISQEMIDHVERLALNDRRIKVRMWHF